MTAQKSDDAPRRFMGLAILGIALWWLLGSAIVPVVQDEAYYFLWSRALDGGYLDHPPLVALLGMTSHLLTGSVFAARLGTVAVSIVMLFAAAAFFRRLGLRSRTLWGTAMLLTFANVLGLISGFITTPDAGLLCCWCLALNEAAAALSTPRNRWRWLTAGLVTGLGLTSKYTMLLMGPVFLWGLIGCDRKALRTFWPYAGGLIALLTFAPNLYWNAQHDWLTFKFQLRRGFTSEHINLEGQNALPRPLPPLFDSAEAKLGAAFDEMQEAQREEEALPHWYDSTVEALNRYIGFYASQLGLWGAFLPLLLTIFWRRRQNATPVNETPDYHQLKPLVTAGWAVPLIIFGLLSLRSKVEANWSAMYIISAAAALTPYVTTHLRGIKKAAWINLAIAALALAHAHWGLLPLRPKSDRILKETHGYNRLAERLQNLEGYVFADSYQITSMVNFYSHELLAQQWPGITRDSELIRRPEFITRSYLDLEQAGYFWLVTTDRPPPRLPGFVATSLSQLRDCKNGGLQEILSTDAMQVDQRCKKVVHEWYLTRYQKTPTLR